MPPRSEPAASDADTITVDVRVFARYAELLGCDRTSVPLPAGATVRDAVRQISARAPGGERLAATALAAVNRRHARLDQILVDGDELALLPPLAGG